MTPNHNKNLQNITNLPNLSAILYKDHKVKEKGEFIK